MAETFTAEGLLNGFTEKQIVTLQQKAFKDLSEGREITSYGDQGKNVGKTRVMPVGKILKECRAALQVLNPTVHGNPREHRRAHANFGGIHRR